MARAYPKSTCLIAERHLTGLSPAGPKPAQGCPQTCADKDRGTTMQHPESGQQPASPVIQGIQGV